VPPDELPYASGLFNLTRNLGGAIGIAAVTTWLQDFGRIHADRLGESMSTAGTAALANASAHIARLTSDAAHARLVLEGELAQYVGIQSLSLAFDDVFLLMAGLFAIALVLVPFSKGAVLSDSPAPFE
jgi:DHA2 family multidrug resistance protein